jgi:hypothetical protein
MIDSVTIILIQQYHYTIDSVTIILIQQYHYTIDSVTNKKTI